MEPHEFLVIFSTLSSWTLLWTWLRGETTLSTSKIFGVITIVGSVIIGTRNKPWVSKERGWKVLEWILRHIPTSNFHRHTSGSIHVETLAKFYVENAAARAAFEKVPAFRDSKGRPLDPTNPTVLASIMHYSSRAPHGMQLD